MENNNLNTKTPKEVVEDNKKSTIFNSKAFKITLIVLLILLAGIGYWFFNNSKLINSYSDKVYPGAYILHKDLSGLTIIDVKCFYKPIIENDLDVLRVFQHNNISGKDCPAAIRDQGYWQHFRDLISLEKFGMEHFSGLTFEWKSGSDILSDDGYIAKNLKDKETSDWRLL